MPANVNLIWELQKAVYHSLTNIEFLIDSGIKIFSYVPQNANYPFIKIGDLQVKNLSSINKTRRQIDYSIKILGGECGSQEIIKLTNCIENNFTFESLNNSIDQLHLPIKISGFKYEGSSMKENITYRNWFAGCRFNIIVEGEG